MVIPLLEIKQTRKEESLNRDLDIQGIRNREEYQRKKEENERKMREIEEMQQKVEEIERELAL